MPLETILAAGYALLLAAVATALEWAARRVHRRSKRLNTAGFRYRKDLDLWQCPTGQHLHRHGAGLQGRVVYRAPAPACNRCHAKASCTDSDQGRTLEIQPDAWVNTTMARFHRGLSLALLLLAELMLGVESVRIWGAPRPSHSAAWLLAALMLLVGVVTLRLAQHFFAPPEF
ncbi:MAG: transposase [Terriglobales bacterium]